MMTKQLEQDIRRAVENFAAEIDRAARDAVARILRSALDGISSHMGEAGGNVRDDTPLSSRAPRRALTADELASMRTRLASLIREQPGQSTAELARALGLSSGKLRPELRQLADAGAIRIEKHCLGGLSRYTYFATELRGPGVDASIAAA